MINNQQNQGDNNKMELAFHKKYWPLKKSTFKNCNRAKTACQSINLFSEPKIKRQKTMPTQTFMYISEPQIKETHGKLHSFSSIIDLNSQLNRKSNINERKIKSNSKFNMSTNDKFMTVIRKKEQLRERNKMKRIFNQIYNDRSVNINQLKEKWNTVLANKTRQNFLATIKKTQTNNFKFSCPNPNTTSHFNQFSKRI